MIHLIGGTMKLHGVWVNLRACLDVSNTSDKRKFVAVGSALPTNQAKTAVATSYKGWLTN